jgi:DNA-binding transcriptional regulator YhcF (GntR family)
METSITYEEGHAHVAAIRVLSWRLRRLPTIEEVAEVLGSKVELTNHRLRALESLGIVTVVQNPFETHVSVEDYLALEKLPVEANQDALRDAVQDFRKRQNEKADEMVRLFEEADEAQEKREKHDQMAEDLRRFKKKKPKKAPWESHGPGE